MPKELRHGRDLPLPPCLGQEEEDVELLYEEVDDEEDDKDCSDCSKHEDDQEMTIEIPSDLSPIDPQTNRAGPYGLSNLRMAQQFGIGARRTSMRKKMRHRTKRPDQPLATKPLSRSVSKRKQDGDRAAGEVHFSGFSDLDVASKGAKPGARLVKPAALCLTKGFFLTSRDPFEVKAVEKEVKKQAHLAPLPML